jgi:hypothetical protein
VEFLLQQRSPRQVLEACLQAIDQRGFELAELGALARRGMQTLEALKCRVEVALAGLTPAASAQHNGTNGTHGRLTNDWQPSVVTYLRHWQEQHGHEDCPLPELFDRLRQDRPALTLGQFHDGLRTLHERGQLYLHPWTGPMHELPDPTAALVVGHAVVFYASLRMSGEQ